MEIMLLTDIKKLGRIGEKVTVKSGYARNYLFKVKKAIKATRENIARFNEEKERIQKINNEKRSIALQSTKILEGKTFVLTKKAGDDGKLYGSVGTKDIINLLSTELNMSVHSVDLSDKIKKIGIYDITVKLHPDISANLKLKIIRLV